MDMVRAFHEASEAQRYHEDMTRELQQQRAQLVRRMQDMLFYSPRQIAVALELGVEEVEVLLRISLVRLHGDTP